MQFCRPFKQESVNDYPEGYPQLAALVSSDDTFAIFRKFGRTSSRVLLHLQSEIATLEEKLSDLDRTDADGDSPTAYRLKSTRHKEGWDTKQRDIIHQLQEKFAIYYDLLLKDNQLRVLGPPLKRHHRYLFYWIEGKKPVIEGEDDWILHQDDLVQLANIDHFQSFLSSSWLNRLFAPSKQGDQSSDPVVTYFSQNRVATTTKLLSVLVAVAVLIIPVFILFWGSLDRGGMSATVLVSAIVFSVLLSLSTKIEIREVLLGAAAYCAVLATFLGNLQPAVSQKAFVNQ
ncbi:hypothetical protein BDZ45DRAFT_730490 [Acephala macrosclerotiorum]|nr:hypothetical protein BDZ45DRAFT_730490 [Acephala macrosclerotiorum]